MANFPNFEKQKQTIDSYSKKVDINNYDEIMSLIYKYIKEVTPEYYVKGKMDKLYDKLWVRVYYAEDRFASNVKILGAPILINQNEELKNGDFINNLIIETRKYLVKNALFYNSGDELIDFSQLNLTNYCETASDFVSKFCKFENVECYKIPICPGYNKTAELFDGVRWHYANIVKYNNEYYLVDLTISQFFYKYKNNLDRLGVIGCDGCYPGMFMMLDEKRKNIATTLLNEGYIKLDEATFKAYMDAFTISFRNGLYYEDTNDFSYTTNYSTDDYIRFLNGEDDQIKHEGRENLGYQKRPLKNSSLEFRR